MKPFVTCLWFDRNAEEAVDFYQSVFPGSRVIDMTRYPESDHPAHVDRAGEVMVIRFELRGQPFLALNGGPQFRFNEAVSFVIECETQEEADRYWEALTPGGDPEAQQCGWLKDRFGVSWQVTPRGIERLFQRDAATNERVMKAMVPMKKLDYAALLAAAAWSPDRPSVTLSSRTMPFAPEAVFAAFTDPERLARWWGPRGFSNDFRTCEIRPGGIWEFDMIGPDGTRYRNETRFLEFEAPRRIVIEHLREVHYFILTISLTPQEGGTRIDWEMDFQDPAECKKILSYVPVCNEEVFDRLEAELSR
jgi:predicted 3-demethylubiquinone-9 3-methyltransferase (glyoxalase superfamily)/uncharacterized protein YndB with AHSA1/START domain